MNDYDRGYRDGWRASADYSLEADTIGNNQSDAIPLAIGVITTILGMFGIVRQFELDLQFTSSIILPIAMLMLGMVIVGWVMSRSSQRFEDDQEKFNSEWQDRLPKE